MNANTKSVILFLLIYLGSMGILASIIGYLYFHEEKAALIEQTRQEMQYKAKSINARLEFYHTNKSETFTFYDEGYGIALYDINRTMIASTFIDPIDFKKLFYTDDGNEYYLVETIFKEYLGVKYIVIKTALPLEKMDQILQDMIVVALYGFLFLLIVALLLSRVMLYPVRNTMNVLKKFIKNTTHEMNTPISTILMSYEHLDKTELTHKQLRSLNRIEIAAKTLLNLYNDLSFASFHEHIEYQDSPIDVKQVVLERVKYFDTLLEFKEIRLSCKLEQKTLQMDKRKLTLIIDNLLSNAIKYSKQHGFIEITLTEAFLSIRDEGIGISEDDQTEIFQRFKRIKAYREGFGVGLDIVSQICDEYNINIVLNSRLSKGSEFKLLWAD
ncbi:sensor histidine kinase [Sulfurovum mangrovi]|uniref:sensor histidine kinase n=1 Tax=Sulfurovum mangrovi TaxID=2893889 RepID=UPI001E45D48C|nr:HAMP domain-containing sensor histidine kinase [Sulfurovum mangrovi]UFH58182.1 HAMP domain-containing histidine kinase [Sulfurovum mangrovi]